MDRALSILHSRHEFMLAVFSLSLAFVSSMQLCAVDGIPEPNGFPDQELVLTTVTDVLLVLFSNLASGAGAADFLDSFVSSFRYRSLDYEQRKYYAKARKGVVTQELLCVFAIVIACCFRYWIPSFFAVLITLFPMVFLAPYYILLLKRLTTRINEAYGAQRKT